MIAHRVQTHTIPEPPIKVYRIIAITFLLITIALLGIVIFTMLKKTEITIVAKEDIKPISTILTAEPQKSSNKSLSAIVTSTQFYFSANYSPTATREVDGTATGEAVIYNKTNEVQVLVKTTRLLTPDNKLFRLSDRVTIPANGQVAAKVYADQAGADFDIGPSQFTIPGLSPDRQKFVYAESLSKMSGGSGKVGVISEADYRAAKADFAKQVKEKIFDSIIAAYPGLNSKIVSVTKNGVTSTFGIGAETSNFTLYGTSTVAIIFYNDNDLEEILQKEVGAGIDSGSEKILSIGENPELTIVSVDDITHSAQIQVTAQAAVTLDANAPLLNKENFLNKNKSEIERYIVALPHVTNMSVKFTPSWISKTPSVADKLKIIVKSVK